MHWALSWPPHIWDDSCATFVFLNKSEALYVKILRKGKCGTLGLYLLSHKIATDSSCIKKWTMQNNQRCLKTNAFPVWGKQEQRSDAGVCALMNYGTHMKDTGENSSKSCRLIVCVCLLFTMLRMFESSYYLLQKSSRRFPLGGRNLLHPIWGLHPDDLQSNNEASAWFTRDQISRRVGLIYEVFT